jgi:hypothetical protein
MSFYTQLRSSISLLLLSFFVSCIPTVERSLFELASFVRSQSNRTSGRIFVNVAGLQGSGLLLSLNENESLSVSASGEVVFQTSIDPGANYSVTVRTQPTNPTQTCTVSGGTGTLVSGDVKSIIVNCGVASYTLGGTITGLAGSGLVLSNNGSATVSISSNGSFAFPATYEVGSSYAVTVSSAPSHPGQSCVITNGTGSFSSANNVSNISIACTTTAYAVRVNVSGIGSGNLVLTNNSSDSLTMTSNGSGVFTSDVSIGSTYSVVVTSAPSSHTCALTGASGTISTAEVTVTVNCFSLLNQTPVNLSLLYNNQTISLRFSAAVTGASCSLGAGTLSRGDAAAIIFSVSTTNITNDTLILSAGPSTWNTGSIQQTFTCTSAAGNALAAGSISIRYSIPNPANIRYVSSASGNDSNAGTSTGAPFLTIHRGIADLPAAACAANGDCVVLVEDGTYEATDGPLARNEVTISPGISVYGGYTAGTSFGTRNGSARLTIIQNSTPVGCGTATFAGTPCDTVLIGVAVSNKTVVDGFRILGASHTSETVGVYINGGNALLANNQIIGGTATSSAGMLIRNFGGTNTSDATMGAIVANVITGGNCTGAACEAMGVYWASTNVFPFFQFNVVSGGNCFTASCKSYGILAEAGNAANVSLVQSNTFSGGNLTSPPAGSESIGAKFASNALAGKINRNVFNGGTAVTSIGIEQTFYAPSFSIGDNATKVGNLIVAGSGTSQTFGIRLLAGGNVASNSISAGSVSASGTATTYGLHSAANGVVSITGNRIFGGNATSTGAATSTSYGLFLASVGAASNLDGNHISAGNSSNTGTSNAFSYGIYFSTVANAVNVINNLIDGGTCTLSQSSNTCESHALVFFGNSVASRVYHNTLFSGTAEDRSTPLYFAGNASSNADIQNNVLFAEGSATLKNCLLHEGVTNLSVINGNALFGCYPYISYTTMAISADTFCAGGKISTSSCADASIYPISSLNVLVNPTMTTTVTGFNMRFRSYSSSSPCSATRIANHLGAVTALDALSAARPGGNATISAGALEYDGTCQ